MEYSILFYMLIFFTHLSSICFLETKFFCNIQLLCAFVSISLTELRSDVSFQCSYFFLFPTDVISLLMSNQSQSTNLLNVTIPVGLHALFCMHASMLYELSTERITLLNVIIIVIFIFHFRKVQSYMKYPCHQGNHDVLGFVVLVFFNSQPLGKTASGNITDHHCIQMNMKAGLCCRSLQWRDS